MYVAHGVYSLKISLDPYHLHNKDKNNISIYQIKSEKNKIKIIAKKLVRLEKNAYLC